MAKEMADKIPARQQEILNEFFQELDKHLTELKEGKAAKTFEINDFAAILHIHPTHLSNTIQQATGKSPCDFYEEKLMGIVKELLADTNRSISDIAYTLTFDPSNFTKFFKHFEGMTPRKYRQGLLQEKPAVKI
jgi:AraC-like DNA-binding protein